MLLLLLALMPADRTLEVDGKLLTIPVRAEADGVHLPVNLLVSTEQRTLLATLIDRGWTPETLPVRRPIPRLRYGSPAGHRTSIWSTRAPASTNGSACCCGAEPSGCEGCRSGSALR